MTSRIFIPFLMFLGLTIVLIWESAFVVSETELVVITRLGNPVREAIKKPGLKFKIPFIEKANRFEDRILQWDGEGNRIPTKDKRYLWVDTTARWRIVDPLKFMKAFPLQENAQKRLDDILDGKVREVVSIHTVIEIVRSTNRIFEILKKQEKDNALSSSSENSSGASVSSVDTENKVERIRENDGREKVRSEIFERSEPIMKSFGIELIDVRIKRINYDSDVRQEVYNRMRSERERASALFRSQGEGKRLEIEGLKTRELQTLESEGFREAQKIKGEADAEATKIYADAFSRDPEFYSFLISLESYKQSLKGETTGIFSTENDYLRFLKMPKDLNQIPGSEPKNSIPSSSK
jgi:membrane protease subunit HflC